CGARIIVYAAPAVALLIAAGLAAALPWVQARTRLGGVALALLVLAPAVGVCLAHTVRPTGRAACDGAVEVVLARRQSGDRIASNAWECEYYFRNLGPVFVPLQQFGGDAAGRLWLVLVSCSPEERMALAGKLYRAGWRDLERQEFERVT